MSADTPISPDDPITVTFEELGLAPKILKALDEIGYKNPTPIQAKAIPAALAQRDVLGIAQTGTGKTGAFTLPTMHKLSKGRARARMPRCLIVCPTRELAAQVAEDVRAYGKYLKLEMALLIGGVSFAEQDRKLMKGVDILIATPGRLLDQFERGKILMTGVQTLVVDEADRMLDMGFIPDIERIFELTPFTRQTLFFSATMPPEIKRLVDQFLHQPETIQIARRNSTAKTVRQRIIRVPSSDAKLKRTALRWIIDEEDVDSGIVFCNRKRDVDIVAKSLSVHGHNAAPIHGDLAQSIRTKTLDKFKDGEIQFLVASDVAARGLDVSSVSHVFNYDVPFHSEDYVHRIGRTGRAGRKGDAIMLVAPLDDKHYQGILDLIAKDEIEEIDVPGIEEFPRDGGRRSGGRSGRSGGRSGGRTGGRNGRRSAGRSDRNRSKSRKTDDVKAEWDDAHEDRFEEEKPKRRRSADRRRAAPKGRTETEATRGDDDAKPESQTSRKRDEAPKSRRTKATTRDRDDRVSRKEKTDRRDRNQSRKSEKEEPARSRRSNKRGDDKDRNNKVKGFGADVPAFFDL